MKKSELFFSFLLVPLDYTMIVLAAVSAYHVRFSKFTTQIRPANLSLPFFDYLQSVLVIGVLWLIIFALSGLYYIGPKKYIKEVFRVLQACSTGLVLVVIAIFISRELFESRFIVLAAWSLSVIYVSVARGIVRYLQRSLFKFGVGIKNIVIVGAGKTSDILVEEFSKNTDSGYKIVKRIRDFSSDTEKEIKELMTVKNIDEIIQADPNLSKLEVLKLHNFTDENRIVFKFTADLIGAKMLKTDVAQTAGIPIVEVIKTPLDGWGRIIKRVLDIVFASFFILLFSPIFIILSLIVKLDSRGPVIYKNRRVGKDAKPFRLYKFRSMLSHLCIDDDKDNVHALKFEQELIKKQNSKQGPVYKIQEDPRLTRVGKFIRRWSLDELPQFFNVLAGNMSVVGPRPHQPREVAKYEGYHKKVLTIKPGITGLAQISGRSDLDFEEEIRLDNYYIENWSIILDISVILRTPLAIIRSRKVE